MLKVVVGFAENSRLDRARVDALLACYYKREEFKILPLPKTSEATEDYFKEAEQAAYRLRADYPQATLCVAVVGNTMPFPTAEGALKESHTEHGMYFNKESSRPRGVLLAPDLNYILREPLKRIEEAQELPEGELAPQKETDPVDALVNCIRIDLGDWTDESEKLKH